MARRPDPSCRHLAERDLPGIGKAYSLDTLDTLDTFDGARVTAFIAGYVLVLSLLAPVLATHAERIARPFGPRPSDIVPTGGAR